MHRNDIAHDGPGQGLVFSMYGPVGALGTRPRFCLELEVEKHHPHPSSVDATRGLLNIYQRSHTVEYTHRLGVFDKKR
jgi:hypothetical protein